MKNIKTRPFAFFLFAFFALSFVGLSLATRSPVTDLATALTVAYKTIPILLGLWLGFSLYAWKWWIFKSWLVPFPNLEGTWHGTIQTTWANDAGITPGPIPVVLTIKQSFGRVSCVMRTSEMTSRSYLADFWLDDDEQLRRLGYCYTSSPAPSLIERSQPHDGTIVFEIVGDPVAKLRGHYWTTRKTTGEVVLTFRSQERLDEFPTDLGDHPMKGQ